MGKNNINSNRNEQEKIELHGLKNLSYNSKYIFANDDKNRNIQIDLASATQIAYSLFDDMNVLNNKKFPGLEDYLIGLSDFLETF